MDLKQDLSVQNTILNEAVKYFLENYKFNSEDIDKISKNF